MPADFQNELPGAHGHPGNYRKITNCRIYCKNTTPTGKTISPQTLKKLVHFSYFPIFRIKDQPTERKISITIGFSPLKKNSTAITITISPINRIITLLPVSPSILIIREELLKIRYHKVITTATAMNIIILVSQSVALFHITIALVIAPGPHNIGIDKGVIEISLT